MKTSDFSYELPPELIAQHPAERRDASRLMTLNRATGEIGHYHFYDLPRFLCPGDCLILNDSRVIPARLLGTRQPGGGVSEILLLTERGAGVWECLVRPGRKLRPGTVVTFGGGELSAEILERLDNGNRLVKFTWEGIFLEVLERLGEMPLPPYIREKLRDKDRYQTVYAKINGSAAVGDRSDPAATVSVEGCRNRGSRSVRGPRPHAAGDTTEDGGIDLYGIPEGKEQPDDI